MEVENDLFHQSSKACLLHKEKDVIVLYNGMECPFCRFIDIYESDTKKWESLQSQYLCTATAIENKIREEIMDRVRLFITKFI